MKIDFCTIASANYLPRVKVLEQSLKAYHPESRLHILLCEHPQEVAALSQEAGHAFLAPDAICSDWQTLAFRYEITEYNTALKPYLLEFLLNTHCDAVIYLDPDIEVFSPLDSVMALFESHDLLLTPHVCLPLEVDGLRSGMDDIIRAGVYNLGFIGISGRDEARRALRWWRDVCRDYCYFAEHRYFVDQFWAAALPAFIQRFHCLRDPGCNVAYWNIFQRRLAKSGNRWLVDNDDLKFFHFSGLPEDLRLVSRHQNRVTTDSGTDLYELLASYQAKVSQNSWDIFSAHPYSFGSYSDHSPIKAIERLTYDEMTTRERVELGNPFEQSARMLAAGRRRAPRSFSQKYFRLLAAKGFVAGHHTLFAYLGGQIAQRIKGIQKSL